MHTPIHLPDLEIRRELEPGELDGLSEAAADAADEEGYLDGNQHYQDLRTASLDDVRFALERERNLIQVFAAAADPAAAELAFMDSRDPDDERLALWNLDVGIAAPVLALGVLGAHTVLSCNGGAFGSPHFRDIPCIRFYPATANLEVLLDLAARAGVGLVAEGRRGLLYARSILDLQLFATLALDNSRPPQSDGTPNEVVNG